MSTSILLQVVGLYAGAYIGTIAAALLINHHGARAYADPQKAQQGCSDRALALEYAYPLSHIRYLGQIPPAVETIKEYRA